MTEWNVTEAWDLARSLTERELGPEPGWRYVWIALVAVPAIAILATSIAGVGETGTRMATGWTTLIVVGATYLFERSRRSEWSKAWERNLRLVAPDLPQPDGGPTVSPEPSPPPPSPSGQAQVPATKPPEVPEASDPMAAEPEKPTPPPADVALGDRLASLNGGLAAARQRQTGGP